MIDVLIGITGRFGTGKNTLADMIAEEIISGEVVGFADALKRDVTIMCMAALRNGWTYDQMRAWLEQRKATIFGPLLQGYGELMRQLKGENYWIERLERKLPDRAIVADVRHLNEAEWVLGNNGLLVAIDGPCRRPGDQRSTTHPSEAQVDQCALLCHIDIQNTGSLDDLREHARSIACRAVGTIDMQGNVWSG